MKRELGAEHPSAGALNNLAVTLGSRQEYAEAEAMHREALAMDRKLVGTEHPKVAIGLGNLAATLTEQMGYERVLVFAGEPLPEGVEPVPAH